MQKRIADLGEIQIGMQIRGRLELADQGSCYVIQIKDVDEETGFSSSSLDLFTPDRTVERYIVRECDVLFLARGKRNFAVTARRLPSSHPTVALSSFYIVRVRSELILPDFLSWAINQPMSQEYLRAVSTGTGIPFVSKESFEGLAIDLPSIGIQESIVHLLELWKREKSLREQLIARREELVRGACYQLMERTGGTST